VAASNRNGRPDFLRNEWTEIIGIGKMAEVAAEYFSGAFSVYVEGRLKTEERESKEGDRSRVKRSSDLS